jgi:hypothetical protein
MEIFQGGKIEKVSTRQFGPWTTPRIKADNSKFLNCGWRHIFDKRKFNNLKLSSLLTGHYAWFTLICFEVTEK